MAYIGITFEVKQCDTNENGICQKAYEMEGSNGILCRFIPVEDCMVKSIVGKDYFSYRAGVCRNNNP